MSAPPTAAAPPAATEKPPLTTGIIDEHDADVLMAVKALGDMKSQGAATSSSPTSCRSDSGTSKQASHALSRPRATSNSEIDSAESEAGPAECEEGNGDFVSRVSTLPLVTSMLSAYSQTKASSRVVKYGAQMVESSVKTISKPVMNRLPTAQLDEFACRQLDRLEQRYGRAESPREGNPSSTRMSSDARIPTPRSQVARDAGPGPGRGHSLDWRAPNTPSTPDYTMHSHVAGSGVPTESDRQVATRSRWQAMLLEAGGIGAAVSDGSMERLKYCLQWLQYATNRIDGQIAVLREFLDSLQPGAGRGGPRSPTHMDTDIPVSPAALARLSAVKRDVVDTIKQAVDIVSRYAGGALPEPARETVRSVLLSLPERWARASQEGANDGPGHRRTASGSARAPYPFRSNTTAGSDVHSARPGPRPLATAGTAAQAAQRVMTLATESLDMMQRVTGVVKDSLDRAEVWVDRLRVVGLQRGERDTGEPIGPPPPRPGTTSSHYTGIPGTPALTSGSASPHSLSFAPPISPMTFSYPLGDAFIQPYTGPSSAYSSMPPSTASSDAGSDTETDDDGDAASSVGQVRKRRNGGGPDPKRHKDTVMADADDVVLPPIRAMSPQV